MVCPRLAALLLLLQLLLTGLSASIGIGCLCLPHWNACCRLASHMDDSFTETSPHIPCHTRLALSISPKPWDAWLWNCPCCLCLHLVSTPSGLQWGWFHHLIQKYKKSYMFQFCGRHKMPASVQRKLLGRCCLSEKGHHISTLSPDISHERLRFRRTQSLIPEAVEGLPRQDSQRHKGPEFYFDLLPEARAIRVSIPPGPEVNVRLCHQWALECEELSSPFDAQKTVSWGHTVDLPYEFFLPCLCIEASYLQEDTVRRKKCPFESWPEAYGSDFWKSVNFTDHSHHSQMIMALTLRCPLKLEASLCQRQGWHTLCEDFPNATAQESEGWYVLEKVDLHPQLCFKFSYGNSSHVECPHQTAPSWTVSMEIQAQQLILHFSTKMHATFSAAWSHPDLGQDSLVPPVYSISQGSNLVTLDLIIPFLRPGGCVLTPGTIDSGTAGSHHPIGSSSGPNPPAPTVRPRRSAAGAASACSGLRGAAAPRGSSCGTAEGHAGQRARRDRGPVGGNARGTRRPAAVAVGGADAGGAGAGHRAAAVEQRRYQPLLRRGPQHRTPARPAPYRPAPASAARLLQSPLRQGRHSPTAARPAALSPAARPASPAAGAGRPAFHPSHRLRPPRLSAVPAESPGTVPPAGTRGSQTCPPRLSRAPWQSGGLGRRRRGNGWHPKRRLLPWNSLADS
ncbi:interleukin-17 receptor E isoform X1 [Saccopteryx leptura]|uniref:interleukin-17 receptor E isoform X1 n=1 Tax=Saccopteryx leptura TaxID=249018 RepID=UPI00339C6F53